MALKKNNSHAWLYILPALILLAAFLVYPTIQTFKLSLYGGLGFTPKKYVGLDNYVQLLTKDRYFLSINKWPPSGALVNNIIWLVVFTAGTVGFGLLIAVLADRVKYETYIKSIVFLPMVISATAASVIFRFVYSPDTTIGALNAFLALSLPDFKPVPWLGRTNLVNLCVIWAGIWIWTGLSMTVLSAAYKALDRNILEAATVDGADEWQKFWRISVPMMANPIGFVMIAMIINALKMLDLILVMTKGGPRNASRVIGFSFYWEVFNNQLVGYGSAIAMIMLMLLAPIMVIQVRRLSAQGNIS
jgi:alpha-glucoside transport system permease protein